MSVCTVNVLIVYVVLPNENINLQAYRLKLANGRIAEDCNDDGESQAGGRLLHLLNVSLCIVYPKTQTIFIVVFCSRQSQKV